MPNYPVTLNGFTFRGRNPGRSLIYYYSIDPKTPTSFEPAPAASFLVLAEQNLDTVPVYLFTIIMHDDPTNPSLVYYYSTDATPPCNFTSHGPVFYAYANQQVGTVPVHVFTRKADDSLPTQLYYYSSLDDQPSGYQKGTVMFWAFPPQTTSKTRIGTIQLVGNRGALVSIFPGFDFSALVVFPDKTSENSNFTLYALGQGLIALESSIRNAYVSVRDDNFGRLALQDPIGYYTDMISYDETLQIGLVEPTLASSDLKIWLRSTFYRRGQPNLDGYVGILYNESHPDGGHPLANKTGGTPFNQVGEEETFVMKCIDFRPWRGLWTIFGGPQSHQILNSIVSTADIEGLDLSGVIFYQCNVRSCNFSAAKPELTKTGFVSCSIDFSIFDDLDLRQTKFAECSLQHVTFLDSKLNGDLMFFAGPVFLPSIAGARFKGAAISGHLNLSGVNCTEAELSGATFDQLTLDGADLTGAKLAGIDLRSSKLGPKLSGADMSGCVLGVQQLKGAQLGGAKFVGCDLTECELPSPLTSDSNNPIDLTKAKINVNQLGKDWSNLILDATEIVGLKPGTDLKQLKLTGTTLSNLTLEGTLLDGTDFNSHVLTNIKLTGASLNRAQFRSATLTNCSLSNCKGKETDFSGATLSNTSFSGAEADWTQTCFAGATGTGPNFTNANLEQALFNVEAGTGKRTQLDKTTFTGANLAGSDLTKAKLTSCQFVGANLEGASLIYTILSARSGEPACDLSYAWMANANLSYVDLYGAILAHVTMFGTPETSLANNSNFEQADFSGAFLTGMNFSSAQLKGVRFDNACLVNADLSGADLSPAKDGGITSSLTGACLQGAIFDPQTRFASADLSNAAFDFKEGTIDLQYCDTAGEVTDPLPTPFAATPIGQQLQPSNFSANTTCPNGHLYSDNENGIDPLPWAQMLSSSRAPQAWKPSGCKPVGKEQE